MGLLWIMHSADFHCPQKKSLSASPKRIVEACFPRVCELCWFSILRVCVRAWIISNTAASASELGLGQIYSRVLVHWNLSGRKWEKEQAKGLAQGMRLVPVLWNKMSVKNTRPKYIGHKEHLEQTQPLYCDACFAVTYSCKPNIQPVLPAFLKYLPCVSLPEIYCGTLQETNKRYYVSLHWGS
jgi:hypothetical protein